MKRKRIMIIGPQGVGKTSLANWLNGVQKPLRRTADVLYGARTLEVPSAYLENTWMYRYLIALSQDAWCIVVMVDQSKPQALYSPGFASAFRCPLIGVIGKCDCCPAHRPQLVRQLETIGVEPPYFAISMATGEGLQALQMYLEHLEGGRASDEIHHRI